MDYGQIAPLGFMWAELAVARVLGLSEGALRLLPFVAGVLAMLLFWRFARKTLNRGDALLAVAIFAASYFPVRHASEVKPYGLLLTQLVVSRRETGLLGPWLVLGLWVTLSFTAMYLLYANPHAAAAWPAGDASTIEEWGRGFSPSSGTLAFAGLDASEGSDVARAPGWAVAADLANAAVRIRSSELRAPPVGAISLLFLTGASERARHGNPPDSRGPRRNRSGVERPGLPVRSDGRAGPVFRRESDCAE